jgi:hypothetical protein
MSGLIWTSWLSTALAAPQIEVRGHHQSPAGQAIHLRIQVSNTEIEAIEYPDLTNRPWLVHFNTTDPAGVRRTLFVSAPKSDTGGQWKIKKGERKEVVFSIPTSENWTVGKAHIETTINGVSVGTQDIMVFDLHPNHLDHGQQPIDQVGPSSISLATVYSDGGSDLWFMGTDHTSFVTRAAGHILPQLSVSRAERSRGPWLTWTGANGKIWAVLAKKHDAKPWLLRLPWPKVQRCGRPATDGKGKLIQPICVEGPKQITTKLVAAIMGQSGRVHTQAIVQFKPRQVLTHVDASGQTSFILARPNAVDLASINTDSASKRPAKLRRLWRAKPNEELCEAKLVMSSRPVPEPAVQLLLCADTSPIIIKLAQR